ncbi:MAG: oxidoreductase, partial [Candidatus Omnitrophica bacterium]|nr:oxidoreductase [Candidatus Omnitrophota bacterium]
RIVNVLTDVEDVDKQWCGIKGTICENFVTENLQDIKDRTFYLCGPPAMVASLKKMLTEGLCVQTDKIISENFMGY